MNKALNLLFLILLTGVNHVQLLTRALNYYFSSFRPLYFYKIATIVAGTLAERCQMNAYLYFSMALTGFGEFVRHVWSIIKKF